MASKRILVFSTAYLPFIGGAEIAIKAITDRLGDEIYFDLITTRLKRSLPKMETIGKVNVYRIGIGLPLVDKLLMPFLGAVKTIKLQKRNHYVAYWCVMVTFASGAAYIANWFQRKVPIILTLQEGDSEEWLGNRWFGLINLSWKMALRRTSILTAISNYLLERGIKLGYRGRGELIPNGVDVEKFKNTSVRHLGDKPVLITVSRLVEKNAVGDVIEALKYMSTDVELRIIGTGPLEESLKSKAKSLKLENKVKFLGNISNDEVPKYLHQVDIFIRPSLSEGQGISFIEAMAAGLPVIATPVGGIPDFLKDGETGLFVEPRSPRLIAFQVHKILSDVVLRDRLIINAKRMVLRQYDWDLIAEQMRDKVFSLK